MNQPSETVRYLASYLQEHVYDYTHIVPLLYGSLVVADQEKLAQLIQEFYDKLP